MEQLASRLGYGALLSKAKLESLATVQADVNG